MAKRLRGEKAKGRILKLILVIMKKKEIKKTKEVNGFEMPRARAIKIDTSVSLLLTSLPPGNPASPWGPPSWGKPKW